MRAVKLRSAFKVLATAVFVAAATLGLLWAVSSVVQPKTTRRNSARFQKPPTGSSASRAAPSMRYSSATARRTASFSPLQMWEEHGFTSYVSATSGQRLTYGYRLLEKALRSQKPKVVVFETNSIYSPIKPDDAVLSLFQNKLPVFEYHDRWKSLDAQDFLGKPSATWSDPLKGFVVNRGVNPADAVNHMTPSSEALPVDVVNRQYITAMVEACRANGATPVFVSTPSTVNWNTAKHNGMSELARELGIDYYDLNEGPDKVPIDWSTDTHDKGDHLNFDGATKVSAYMGKLLSEKYGLPDHRSDSAFDRWNASLERYKQQIAS